MPLERLLALYAPMTEQLDGTFMHDPSAGLISKEDFVRLLDEPVRVATPPSSEEP